MRRKFTGVPCPVENIADRLMGQAFMRGMLIDDHDAGFGLGDDVVLMDLRAGSAERVMLSLRRVFDDRRRVRVLLLPSMTRLLRLEAQEDLQDR